MFDEMIASIREDAVHMLLTIEIRQQNAEPKREQIAKPPAIMRPVIPVPSPGPRPRDEDRPQRSLPLRQRQEIQELLW